MVSIVETTAVSLRKGDHSANLGFKGVLAEVVADLGVDGKGTDNNTTLRLHNGVTEGGIPLCRADMLNISTKILAENRQVFNDKNLAYSDLSNIDSELDSHGINTLLSNLRNAGLVTTDELDNYAKKNTSNINTFDLTDPTIHTGADNKNKPLAYADLSNVTGGGLSGLESKSNKVNTITSSTINTTNYPSTRALVDYVDEVVVEGGEFLKKDFKNAISYDVLYSNATSQIYRYDNSISNIMDGGVNFTANTKYYTNQKLNTLEEIQVKVNTVDSTGKPTSISLTMTEGGSNPNFNNSSFIQSDTNKKCYLNLTASGITGYSGLYTFTVSINTTQTVGTGFIAGEIYTINTGSANPPRSKQLLYVKPTLVNAGGGIESFEYLPSESDKNLTAATLTVINPAGNATINIISTKTLPDTVFGGKLLKTDLTNLRGMSEEDIQAATNKAWRIGYHENLPNLTEGIDDSSYLDIATAGMVWTALYGASSNLANSSLSNLSNEGQNIIDSHNNTISNSILEIPQNIKLTLDSNVLTLKAGSILTKAGSTYTTAVLPDTITSTISNSLTDGSYIIFASTTTIATPKKIAKVTSGDSSNYPTTNLDDNTIYFNTTDQIIYKYNSSNSSWVAWNVGYPIAKIEMKSGVASFAKDSNGNDMIFNGASFIGHHAIIYPGIEGLISVGINNNATLKSTNLVSNTLTVIELNPNSVTNDWKKGLFGKVDNSVGRAYYRTIKSYDELIKSTDRLQYVENNNVAYVYTNENIFETRAFLLLGSYSYDGTVVTDFTIRQPIRLVTTEMLNDFEGGESKRNIGEIVASTLPLTDAGLHLLDGSLIQGNGAYADFVTYIAGLTSSHSSLFITEADWQASIVNYGVCGKFVYNSTNNTLRLPKITGFIEGTNSTSDLGNLVEAGLPNITGTFAGLRTEGGTTGTDVFQNNGNYNDYASANGSAINNSLSFDASRSSSIYGNSNTVQPQSVKVYYYIVIANTKKTSIQVNIDQVMSDVNNKADRADFFEVQTIVETYQNGTEWYRIWSDGWIEQGGIVNGTAYTDTTMNVIFLKQMSNINYYASATPNTDVHEGYWNISARCAVKTTTGMSVHSGINTQGFYPGPCSWMVCGY